MRHIEWHTSNDMLTATPLAERVKPMIEPATFGYITGITMFLITTTLFSTLAITLIL